MTVPTPTPILANNANVVATLNQPTGLIRPAEAPPKRNQVKNACSKYIFLYSFTPFFSHDIQIYIYENFFYLNYMMTTSNLCLFLTLL